MAIGLITIDIGGVLAATPPGRSLGAVLAHAASAAGQVPAELARTVVNTRLHPARTIDDDLVAEVCGLLGIDESPLRNYLADPTPLVVVDGSVEIIGRCRAVAPTVLVSNVSACDRNHMEVVTRELAPHADGVFFSCEQGTAKPDPRVWDIVRGMVPHDGEHIHIGDGWREDTLSALQSGARAIHVGDQPDASPAMPDRFRAVATPRDAVTVVLAWAEQVRAVRPALPVRASAVVRDAHGHVLLLRGPDDTEGWSLPGGRCEVRGQNPGVECARELWEELGLTVELGADQQRLTAWSRHESSRGENKITMVFDAGQVPAGWSPDPDPYEVAELGWFGWDAALRVAHPRERERLDAYRAGRWLLYQE